MVDANSPAHGVNVVRLADGRLELTAADGGPVRVALDQIRSLVADMVISCMPPTVLESAMLLFNGQREDLALAFITPALGLGGQTPVSLCATEDGQREVSALFLRLYYGVYA